MTVHEPGTMLTTVEVAALLHVHPKHVYRLLRRGLPGRRIGGEWRFVREEVLAWSGGAVATSPSEPVGAPPSHVAPLLAVNGDVVIEMLLDEVNAKAPPHLGMVVADRTRAIGWLADDVVLAAGFHGDAPPPRLDDVRLARIHLVEREVGFAVRAGEKFPSAKHLGRTRFAARPRTAGISAHLARWARHEGVKLASVLERATRYASHREVVFSVVRGETDVGLTTHAYASRAGLAFRAIAREPYGLVVRSERLGDPVLVRLCEIAQSKSFEKALAGVAGYDAARCGQIVFDPDDGAVTPRDVDR